LKLPALKEIFGFNPVVDINDDSIILPVFSVSQLDGKLF
jgi:hypothetical protein